MRILASYLIHKHKALNIQKSKKKNCDKMTLIQADRASKTRCAGKQQKLSETENKSHKRHQTLTILV